MPQWHIGHSVAVRAIVLVVIVSVSVVIISPWIFAAIDLARQIKDDYFGPRIRLMDQQAEPGDCYDVCKFSLIFYLWWGQERQVIFRLTLSNEGFADGRGVVDFLADGRNIDSGSFLVVAGEVVEKVHTVIVDGCGEHDYRASLEDVRPA